LEGATRRTLHDFQLNSAQKAAADGGQHPHAKTQPHSAHRPNITTTTTNTSYTNNNHTTDTAANTAQPRPQGCASPPPPQRY
jgi:hypothetical protein